MGREHSHRGGTHKEYNKNIKKAAATRKSHLD